MNSWRQLREKWKTLTPQKRIELVESYSEAELRSINWWYVQFARDKQVPPDRNWIVWLIRSGRGFGKTRTGSEWIIERARSGFRRMALVGQTKGDVRDTMIEVGDSSILQVAPKHFMPVYEPSKRRITFPNGAIAMIYSGDEPGQLRGPQHDTAWVDELAKFKYPQDTWNNLEFGLRIGPNPQVVVTSTPRPIPVITELLDDPDTIDVIGSTYENAHNLADSFLKRILGKYEGTRLGRQELHGEILDDNPEALWKREYIEPYRVTQHEPLRRIAIGVDPPGSRTGAECGIIGAGARKHLIDGRDHFYVLEDASQHGSPEQWARAVVTLYYKLEADVVVAEVNNGGDMVESTIKTVDDTVPVKQVRATRGKYVRAEPVAAIYEQGRGHHAGAFPELEDQMCQWDPSMSESPDRLDGLVWAGHELMLGEERARAGTW